MNRVQRWSTVAAGVAVVGLSLIAAAPAGASGSSGGTASGVVTNAATGKGLKGMCVNVVDASDNQTVGTSTPTTKTGAWSLSGIPASTTYTAIAGGCQTSSWYTGLWWDNKNYQPDATQFAVTDGGTTPGIDFALREGGGISGKVTDSVTGKPVAGMLVVALWTGTYQSATYGQCTGTNGKYKIKGVPTSGAKIVFYPGDCGTTSSYPTTFYDGAPDYGSATVVPITDHQMVKNLNEVLTAG